jgi:1-acyl-sn-glycerol-3-phosphate acyltransferase
MRVKIHKQIETFKNRFRQKTYQEEVRDVIYTQLVAFENQSKEKTDVYNKVKRVGHGQLF